MYFFPNGQGFGKNGRKIFENMWQYGRRLLERIHIKLIEEGRAVIKVLIKKLAIFFLFPSKQLLPISINFSCGKLLPKN
jgi:hypothetical protein